MSLLTYDDDPVAPQAPKPVETQSYAPDYDTAVEDTRFTSFKNILSHVSGHSWIVDYYQQQLSRDDELSPQDLSLDPVYQQYLKVSELELKVSSPLSQSQTQETKEFEVTGTATIYTALIPNKGDMFVADIGDGRKGIFTVTEAERLTIMQETAYNVSYILVDYNSDDRVIDLERKTVKHTHFVKKLLKHGTDPILVNEDYNRFISLSDTREKIKGRYFALFFNKSTSTLLVPGQTLLTYDNFVVKAIKGFMNNKENPTLRVLKKYTIELPGRQEPLTLWDALLRHSSDILPICSERLAIVPSSVFNTIPQYEGVYYSNIKSVVYPVDYNNSDLNSTFFKVGAVSSRDITHQFKETDLGSLDTPTQTVLGIDALPNIWPVTKDDYYIFSAAFYTSNGVEMSKLETIVYESLEGKPVNQRILFELCADLDKWGELEQFYYTPILLILIKITLHGL